MENTRQFKRVPFLSHTQVICGNKTFVGELLDISMRGALLLLRDEADWPTGQICYLDIALANSEIHMQFEAELVHREETHYGFKFLSEDIETFTHLRRLLELNVGDAEVIDRELADWMKG